MITADELKKIERLARLRFSDEEREVLAVQLTNIMSMIDDLNEVDCDGVEPLTSVCDMSLRMREDQVNIKDLSSELFSNAPGSTSDFAKEIKCFIVPKVVE